MSLIIHRLMHHSDGLARLTMHPRYSVYIRHSYLACCWLFYTHWSIECTWENLGWVMQQPGCHFQSYALVYEGVCPACSHRLKKKMSVVTNCWWAFPLFNLTLTSSTVWMCPRCSSNVSRLLHHRCQDSTHGKRDSKLFFTSLKTIIVEYNFSHKEQDILSVWCGKCIELWRNDV